MDTIRETIAKSLQLWLSAKTELRLSMGVGRQGDECAVLDMRGTISAADEDAFIVSSLDGTSFHVDIRAFDAGAILESVPGGMRVGQLFELRREELWIVVAELEDRIQ